MTGLPDLKEIESALGDDSLNEYLVERFVHARTNEWILSSSSDRDALAIVDGIGPFDGQGPHYSRRTPGSKTFTGCGQEIVLVTSDKRAVWAVVYQRTPSVRGSGGSRGRVGETDFFGGTCSFAISLSLSLRS